MIQPIFQGTGYRRHGVCSQLNGVCFSLLISLLWVGVLTGCNYDAISQRAEPGSSVVF
jgi:hypothetical protein